MNVVHCKKYLVEVADKQASVTQGNGGVQQDQEEANDELNVDTGEEMKKNGSKGLFINNSFKHCNNPLRRRRLQIKDDDSPYPVSVAVAGPFDFWVPIWKVVRNKLQK